MLIGILFAGCQDVGQDQEERLRRMRESPQYDGSHFVNPISVPKLAPGSLWSMVKRYTIVPRIDARPASAPPVEPLRRTDWTPGDGFSFAWLGHSSFLVALEGTRILVDPVLEERASPLSWIGPRRFHPPPATAEGLPEVDVVLVTHDHYDHLEEPTVARLATTGARFLVPLGIGELLEEWGVAASRIVELDWWQSHRIGSLRFTATPALHYASRGILDGNKRLWCSWSVRGSGRSFFVSGDSGYFDAFERIGEKEGPFDVTFLKIGSYDEAWKQVHMTPEEAARQHRDLQGGLLVPSHWATFDLGLHPWYEPVERLLKAAREGGARVIVPVIGRRIEVERPPEIEFWWRQAPSSPDAG